MFSTTVVVGHIGRNAELRYTPGGRPVCSFSVATNERWTDKTGALQERTTWMRVSVWGEWAKHMHPYLVKGQCVVVEGRIDASAWNGEDGSAKASLELTANKVRLIGGSPKEGNGKNGQGEEQFGPEVTEEEIPF